tara:strand:+ start:207 stop:764 length:558 start_codon:yes stop_codon:yes gene_type:complete
MDDSQEVGNFVNYKPVYLPGSLITFILAYLSFFVTIVFSILLVYESPEWTDFVNGPARDVGEILLITFIISYLSFSYRIVISRNEDIIFIWRQFITSQFQFTKGEYAVNSLHIEEVTRIGGDYENGDIEYTYTTIYSGNQEVITYAGTKKKIQHLVPELLIEKSDSDDIDEVATQPFWSDVSKES